jgi:hypothetical protein
MTATLDDEVTGLRRANAELQRRLDEALAREAATAEVLQVINSSPGELQPVFDILLDKAMQLCSAAFGIMLVMEGDRGRTVAAQGLPPGARRVAQKPSGRQLAGNAADARPSWGTLCPHPRPERR